MNRIILIGNGFDLAHGLKTSYNDFILDVWQNKIYNSVFIDKIDNNTLYSLTLSNLSDEKDFVDGLDFLVNCIEKYKTEKEYIDFKRAIDKYNEHQTFLGVSMRFSFTIKNHFIEGLIKSNSTKDWVDIETEYYRQLKDYATIQDEWKRVKKINTLNQELDQVKDLLDEYLQKTTLKETHNTIETIEAEVYNPFKKNDFAENDLILNIIAPIYGELKRSIDSFDRNDPSAHIASNEILKINIPDFYFNRRKDDYIMLDIKYLQDYYLEYLINIPKVEEEIISLLAVPKDILFLNFNYTSTSDLYAEFFTTNHIHGELNQKKSNNPNPMIFGYGDELSEDYQKLENLNENDVLENVKSIRYLETDNYRNLLSFIESDQYQIYIMGHSCGISDRTLLNTLFEHENCVSIKPFYYEREEDGVKKDNYRELIQNISRNFNDKRIMRSKVVNKKYCNPLPQVDKK